MWNAPHSACQKQVVGCDCVTMECLLLHTLSTGHFATTQAFWDVFLFHYFLGEISAFILIDGGGGSESCSWVAAFCFAFVSKQMHSCHSRSHWRLLSNVIASKLIPMDARLQIQLFQVSVKRMFQRGMQQKLQIYEFKYRRGTDIMIHIRYSLSNTMPLVVLCFQLHH